MRRRAWTTRGALTVAGVCGAVLLTGCGGELIGSPESSPAASGASTTSATTSGTESSAAPATPLEVPDKAARNLCDMMRPELPNWRVQGPTLGRIGLNAMVHEWALTNGGINAQVLADKTVVDRVTIESCSDVHSEAIRALELPDLASGLAF
ncbi:hypothetical protein [Nocardia sp. NBC_01329]|uniref:hypothetical protein n=1 Tax=Nocardia sp. NBC_01329 TaxID=2903594 RepID=UPI002E0D74A3|nr:hypothetical protein OG405_18470 [Nocardia sp. NBC_01329]